VNPNRTLFSDEAAHNTLALNPLIGLRANGLVDSAATLLQWLPFLGELGATGAGEPERAQ
jgi:hypothetical protein